MTLTPEQRRRSRELGLTIDTATTAYCAELSPASTRANLATNPESGGIPARLSAGDAATAATSRVARRADMPSSSRPTRQARCHVSVQATKNASTSDGAEMRRSAQCPNTAKGSRAIASSGP